jgi:hypothetical protein
MSNASRPSTFHYVSPPFPNGAFFNEPASPHLIWKSINAFVDVPDKGLGLFTGTRSEKLNVWKEFKNYVRRSYLSQSPKVRVAAHAGIASALCNHVLRLITCQI